jgi:tetratricopeptide (TPR) repeat protein
VPDQAFYRMYMAHNHHMLAFAAVMQGRSKLALDTIRDTFADVPAGWLDAKENAALADAFAGVPLEVLKRFGRWDEVLKEPEPAAALPFSRAMRHHARGVALAAKGQVREAREEQKALREASKKVPEAAQVGNNIAAALLAIADDVLEGEILFREGKIGEAITALERAVKKEDALRYSEPPDWFVPVRHALGAMLLHDGRGAAAEAVYRDDLRRWPDNGWALHGLAASLAAQGKKDDAAKARERFDAVWKRADVKIPSSCFCVTE